MGKAGLAASAFVNDVTLRALFRLASLLRIYLRNGPALLSEINLIGKNFQDSLEYLQKAPPSQIREQ
jgi:hypothetical protein